MTHRADYNASVDANERARPPASCFLFRLPNDNNLEKVMSTTVEAAQTMASQRHSRLWAALKLVAAAALCTSAYQQWLHRTADGDTVAQQQYSQQRRRLQQLGENRVPSYMKKLTEDLLARRKLFDDTPPEEVKYWFEYSGPLQVRLFFEGQNTS
jgi:hypothetical protein